MPGEHTSESFLPKPEGKVICPAAAGAEASHPRLETHPATLAVLGEEFETLPRRSLRYQGFPLTGIAGRLRGKLLRPLAPRC